MTNTQEFMLLLVSKLYVGFLYPSVCTIQFTVKAKAKCCCGGGERRRLSADQKLWGEYKREERRTRCLCVSHKAAPTPLATSSRTCVPVFWAEVCFPLPYTRAQPDPPHLDHGKEGAFPSLSFSVNEVASQGQLLCPRSHSS